MPSPSRSTRASSALERHQIALMEGRQLFVAANRGPVHYRLLHGRLEPVAAAGGLVTALSAIASYLPLTWIATASGPGERILASRSAPKTDSSDAPRLRFVATSEEALYWFYRRFANPVLWFLQHGMWDLLHRPRLEEMIEKGWMLGYRPVNEAFARVVEQETRGLPRPIVLVHDYHLYLLPGLLRKRVPGALVEHFTHVPWPGPEAWEPLLPPIRRELCKGLLGADIVGFQTEACTTNFLRCCERFVPDARVDYRGQTVWREGRTTRVRSYPISIEPQSLRRLASQPETLRYKERLRPLLGERTIVRVDRLDPSKNIAFGFRAFRRLLERRPDLRGRVRFLAFLVPTRQSIAEYRRYAQEVWREVEEINGRFGQNGWKPVEVFHEDNRAQAMAGMALADVLLVNPVADGMNLVAKEGPMVNEREAALVLSRGCGAHEQLAQGALSISPRDLEATASALEQALEMPRAERRHRAAVLRSAVEDEDLSWWLHRQMEDLTEG